MKRPRKPTAVRANKSNPVVVGSGLLAVLDIVVSEISGEPPCHWAGGTCGNVLIALRYLGWDSRPVARLRSDAAADRILDDLRRWGVSEQFISLADDGSTPVIVERITRGSGDVPRHSFSWRCQECGSQFPAFKAVLAAVAEEIATSASEAQVFFFDRATPGGILLAKACRPGCPGRLRAVKYREPGALPAGMGDLPCGEILPRASPGTAGGWGGGHPSVRSRRSGRRACISAIVAERSHRAMGGHEGVSTRIGPRHRWLRRLVHGRLHRPGGPRRRPASKG